MLQKKFKVSLIIGLVLFFALTFTLLQKQPTYKNEELGVKITGPRGWYVFSPKNEDNLGFLVRFSKYPPGSKKEDYPAILLEVEKIPQDFSEMPKEYIIHNVGLIKQMRDLTLSKKAMKDFKEIVITEEPTFIKINNQDCARYSVETEDYKGNRKRFLEYYFIKANLGYRLVFSCNLTYYDTHTKEFGETLNTFVLK